MLRQPWLVAALYAAITVVMTWPIAARIDRDIPSDLGDPAFVAGILAWGGEHWLALLSGDFDAARRFWNAPIFHPEPLALAYSEHFALHSLLTLPAYAITRNPVLCYNLAFLTTFVVGALGMYLLVRDLTGRRDRFSGAAFVAGLAFAFAPYRIATLPHLQVLSIAVDAFRAARAASLLSQPAALTASSAPARRCGRRTCRAATTCSSSVRSSRCTCWSR